MTDPSSPMVSPLASDVAASTAQDLRSPDARDAALAAAASPAQDLRSPDARDAAREATVVRIESADASPSRSAPSVSDGFEWGDAGIGAAVMLALVGVASGTLLLVGRNRQRTPTT
jgi:hypothetical protein